MLSLPVPILAIHQLCLDWMQFLRQTLSREWRHINTFETLPKISNNGTRTQNSCQSDDNWQVWVVQLMNISSCKTINQANLEQTIPNETTASQLSPCNATFHDFPTEAFENIASRLTYPDICSLRLTCFKAYISIPRRTVGKAKNNFIYHFDNMSCCSEPNSRIERLKIFSESNHQFFSTNNKGETLECLGKPNYKKLFSEFEIKDYLVSLGIQLSSSIFLFTGELDNGSLFLKAPNPSLTDRFIEYRPELSSIVWIGNTNTSMVGNELNFYSFYTGESFSQVIKVFKKVNDRTSLASKIEDLMKHKKVYL